MRFAVALFVMLVVTAVNGGGLALASDILSSGQTGAAIEQTVQASAGFVTEPCCEAVEDTAMTRQGPSSSCSTGDCAGPLPNAYRLDDPSQLGVHTAQTTAIQGLHSALQLRPPRV